MVGDDQDRWSDEGAPDRRLNMFQLLVLAFIVGVTTGILARAAGLGWSHVLLLSWAGSVAGALGITGLVVLVDRMRTGAPSRGAPATETDSLTALIDAWDADLERDQKSARRKSPGSRDAASDELEVLPSSRRERLRG